MFLRAEIASIVHTFGASIRSVGTACTLASVGVYLHRRGFIEGDGKRTLALISQQVTFPLFLFTKIIYCNQDWSDRPCPDVTASLSKVWILLFWPAFVVTMGICVGAMVTRICRTPPEHVKSVLAAVGFANSTGLPITLLTVVHSNFPATSELGRIDPTVFLSVYLLLYPVLQWGIGGWMLAPVEDKDEDEQDDECEYDEESNGEVIESAALGSDKVGGVSHQVATLSEHLRTNVLNNNAAESYYHQHRHGLASSDEGLYISEVDLASMAQRLRLDEPSALVVASTNETNKDNGTTASLSTPYGTAGASSSTSQIAFSFPSADITTAATEDRPLVASSSCSEASTCAMASFPPPPTTPSYFPKQSQYRTSGFSKLCKVVTSSSGPFRVESVWDTLQNIGKRCFQPPVIGALTGITVAVMPRVRGIFVDMVDRTDDAPLQFLFDALYAVGQTAVPINMIILGCNLSAAALAHELRQKKQQAVYSGPSDGIQVADLNTSMTSTTTTGDSTRMPFQTMVGIVIGKLVVMPIVGFLSALILRSYILDIPKEIEGAFYLVILIVFLTPTANNVMIMVELASSNSASAAATKEGIASVIALQYACAPIVLGCTMTIAIGMASNWS